MLTSITGVIGAAEQSGRRRERFRPRSRYPSGRHSEKSAHLRNYSARKSWSSRAPPGAGKTFRPQRIARAAGRTRLSDRLTRNSPTAIRWPLHCADAEKEVTDRDLLAIVHQVRRGQGQAPASRTTEATTRERTENLTDEPELRKTIAVLPGDGIGPEVTRAAVQVLLDCAKPFNTNLSFANCLRRRRH